MVVFRYPSETEWKLVSVRRPCPVCGGAQSCRVNTDGSFACCLRLPSDCAVMPGAWLHRVRVPRMARSRSAP